MSEGAVVQRYAQAIFELATESNELGQVTDQLNVMAQAWAESREMRLALEDPVFGQKRRLELLEELARHMGISGTALNALKVMAVRRRLGALPGVARELARLSDEQRGVLRVLVVSAAPLPDSYYRDLTSKLSAATGKTIAVDKREDPSLIGGVMLHIGDSVIDGSIRGRLSQLERRLLAQATAAQA